jgi:hypothetical protein
VISSVKNQGKLIEKEKRNTKLGKEKREGRKQGRREIKQKKI